MKWEKQSGVGYILDIESTPLTVEGYQLAVINISTREIDQLVELVYSEAELICKDLLKILVLPLNHKNHMCLSTQNDSQDIEDLCDEEDVMEDDMYDDDLEGQEHPAIANITELAAHGATHMSALCDDYEAVLKEARTAPPIIPKSIPKLEWWVLCAPWRNSRIADATVGNTSKNRRYAAILRRL